MNKSFISDFNQKSFISDFNQVDLTKNWVSLDSQGTIISEKKTWLGRRIAVLSKFFGQGSKSDQLVQIANKILRLVQEGKLLEEIPQLEFAIIQLSRFSDSRLQESVKKLGELLIISKEIYSSAILYLESRGGDLSAVLKRYTELEKENLELAKSFILSKDKFEMTFLHRLVAMGEGSLQKKSIDMLQKTLGPELLRECLKAKNEEGKTPIGLAIERGQMVLIAALFPNPPTNKAPQIELDQEEKKLLENNLSHLIKTLSNPQKRAELFAKCPGESNFDKLNHIVDAFHAVFCAGFGEQISTAINTLDQTQQTFFLPYEIRKYADKNKHNKFKELNDKLVRECQLSSSSDEIKEKEKGWGIRRREPLSEESKLLMQKSLKEHGNESLQHIISSVLSPFFTAKEDKKNYYNCLDELLNPLAPDNQKVDFMSPECVYDAYGNYPRPIIERLLESTIGNPTYSMENVKFILEKLIFKHPDLLYAYSSASGNAMEYIKNYKKHSDSDSASAKNPLDESKKTRINQLYEHLIQIEERLDTQLFENRSKRSLKLFLEAKRMELESIKKEQKAV